MSGKSYAGKMYHTTTLEDLVQPQKYNTDYVRKSKKFITWIASSLGENCKECMIGIRMRILPSLFLSTIKMFLVHVHLVHL